MVALRQQAIHIDVCGNGAEIVVVKNAAQIDAFGFYAPCEAVAPQTYAKVGIARIGAQNAFGRNIVARTANHTTVVNVAQASNFVRDLDAFALDIFCDKINGFAAQIQPLDGGVPVGMAPVVEPPVSKQFHVIVFRMNVQVAHSHGGAGAREGGVQENGILEVY